MYDDEESAKAAQKLLDGDDEVEEYEVRPKGFLPFVDLKVNATVYKDADGAIVDYPNPWYRPERTDTGFDPQPQCNVDVEALAAHPNSAYEIARVDHIKIVVHGTDHERVRKVYSEQCAMAIANFDVLIEHERIRRRVTLNIR